MRALPLLLALCLVTGCEKVKIKTQVDAGPICEGTEHLVNGECRFVCTRDSECPVGQRCNLLVGECEPKPPPVDAGETRIPCTEGAVRCSADNTGVQTCTDAGVFETSQQCVQPDGFCQNERCLACRPGAARCASGGATREICTDDGSAYRQVTCAAGSSCVGGECVECTVGQRRCNATNTTVEECTRLPREDLSAGYVPAGDNFDGTCVTQVCEQGASGAQCRVPSCLPGAQRCASTTVQQVCSTTGSWTDITCSTLPNMGASAECLNGACFDECGDAARARSYFGCEYWTTVMENGLTPSIFKGGLTTAGYGTADSEFAFVVANKSVNPTTVTIRRWNTNTNSEQLVKTVNVPGRNDPATKGVAQIKVPWAHASAPSTINEAIGTTGRSRTGYRITTSRPVTVYQFNPLSAVGRVGTCSNANQCNLDTNGTCTGGMCNYFSFSNDASLLLPAHILGTTYVGLTLEHLVGRPTPTGAPSTFTNGSLVIVASQDATDVTVRSAAKTLASVSGTTAVTAMAMGETRTFTLASYEVLQLSSDVPAVVVNGSSAGNLQCGNNPYDPLNSGGSCFPFTCSQICRVAGGDLTGSIVTSTKPIAVFGGAACTLRGYTDTACDHVEEQLFPFVTWGKNFVAARTAPLRLTNDQFASAANAGPDYYKIVAGCPETAPSTPCPSGTLITLSAPPAAADVLSNAGGCAAGTSLSANNCRLASGRFIEFRSKTSFTITADQPIQVAQIFAGQDATTGTTRPAQGDPSLVLLPPVEQWRASYTVLTAPGTRDNYLGIVIDGARVSAVRVDGVTVANWTNLASSTFRIANVPVLVGSHAIDVTPMPNQTSVPGAGVTVYGFDQYVSYGYTGGLDLTTIVTGINPGG